MSNEEDLQTIFNAPVYKLVKDYKRLEKEEKEKRREALANARAQIQQYHNFRWAHEKGSMYQIYCPNCGTYSYFTYHQKLQKETSNPFNDLKCHECGNKQCILMEKVGDNYAR